MIEFLLKRTDGEWFDFPDGSDPYRPLKIPFRHVEGWGNGRIEIDGCQISFSYEDPGIQISFAGQIANERAEQIVEDVRKHIEQLSGQRGESIQISW